MAEPERLKDLLDIDRLQQLLDSFALTGGFVTAILDLDDAVITSSGWQDVCVAFHRASPAAAQRCRRSDAYIRSHLALDGEPVLHQCENGLVDVACPIVVDGVHVGTVFTGQFFQAPPDLERFREQALRFGFEEEAYLDAVRKAPVVDAESVLQRKRFISRLAEILGEMGLDRLQARRALASEERQEGLLRAVIDNAPFGAHMYRLDDDDRLVFIGFNRKAEEMLGFGHSPLLGLTLEEAFPGNVGTDMPAGYRRVARDGGVYDLDQYAYDAGDIAGVFEVHAFNFGPRRMSVFFRDVTEKRKAELALREANEMLAVAQRSSGAGFWSWDVPSEKLTWSPEFFELFGLPADAEASFDTWRAVLYPEDRESAEASIGEAMEQRVPLENEFRIVLPDGGVRWIGATGTTVYDDDGQPLRMSGLCLDIGERKRREDEVRALNEELERRVVERTRELSATNRELQEFVYSVSHDLRSPLRALDGFSMVLLEDYADVLDEEGRGHLERVRAAAQHMAELIDALLALSRVGRREIELQPVDLTAAARAIVDELAAAEPDRAVSISVADRLTARTDDALADIVLRNLLGNAWKFTARTNEAHIEVGSLRERGATAFYVRDDGAGFDPAHAGAMFHPFQRLHSQSEFPGTGIGLATVQRALDKLGGRCWAEGVPGEGATFFFTLA